MSDDATKDHNAKARKEQIVKAFAEYEKLHAERKDIGAAMTEITGRIKEDLAISPAAFKNAFKLWQMEDHDRDNLLTQMRECFDSLGVGQQMDFLTALAREKEREAVH